MSSRSNGTFDEPSAALSGAEQLKRAFDQSFAEPLHHETEPLDDFLAIRCEGEPHALRLDEIASVLPLTALTPMPSPMPELLGITAFKSAMLPVYQLSSLLGYQRNIRPRWLVIAAIAPFGLAVEQFDGYLRLPRSAVARQESGAPHQAHAREMVHAGDVIRPIVSLRAIHQTIETAVRRYSINN